MAELYKRHVRIEGKPGDIRGFMVEVRDAQTNEEIPNVFKAVVYLDASEANRAELTYYETNERGRIVLKPEKDGVAVQTTTVEVTSIDVTALEQVHTHIGGYDCHIVVSAVAGKTHGMLTIEDEARNGIHLYPGEALELLRWLQQERSGLEELAKTTVNPLAREVSNAK